MPTESEPRFLRRFEQIRGALGRHQARLGLASTLLVACSGLGLLAWADYRWELPGNVRAGGLAVATLATVAVCWRWLVAPLRWWTQPRTAIEIENRFPELGQRIRTVVQFAGQPDELIASEGVTPGLVEALERETEARSSPLPLDRIIRRGRARALAALAAVPIAALGIAAIRDPEWRIAIGRAVLVDRPYTTIEVRPGDLMVDRGETVVVEYALQGRPRADTAIQTRPAGKLDAPWKSHKLPAPAKGPATRGDASIAKVRDPLDYRIAAGPDVSPTFRVRVRYPLAIRTLEVRLTPPSYTGLEPRTIPGGDVQGVEGSVATFRVGLDDPTAEASMELVDLSPKPGPLTALPLKREGDLLVATLAMTRDYDYRIVARTPDGRVLPKNRYRVDVREDRAPRVVFDEPGEVLEVHPIAEVRHRIRADDDYGIARAGIVFRLNDGEEKTLIVREYSPAKDQKPTTSTVLEESILMETLAASPQDNVIYYAFAEDNFPAGARRTETDLRYIDIRQFKREYKLAEPGSGDEGDPSELASLDELIGRQRFNLNRATRLAHRRPTDRTAAEDPLKVAGYEETLLNMAREFTEGIQGIADAPVVELQKATDAMQAAVDALDRSKNDEAPAAMAEAVKHLVAARRELAQFIGQNLDPALAAALRKFDRKQAQKIRKPPAESLEAEQLADRIEELADQQGLLAAKLDAENRKAGPAQGPDPEKPAEGDPPAEGSKGQARGADGEPRADPKGEKPTDGPGPDEPGPKGLDRAEAAREQREIADEARAIQEKLKALEAASDLARARMAKAAEKAEKAAGALERGQTDEAARDGQATAGMLHELARQVKGELAREAADQVAMARDLAEELAGREASLTDKDAGDPGPERIEAIAEAAKTLEEWLKQVEKKGDGKAAAAVREILEAGEVAEVVEANDRIGQAQAAGRPEEVRQEAREQADRLEKLAGTLEQLHREIIAPELAAMAELDKRLSDMLAKLEDTRKEPDLELFRRDAALLIFALEKARIDEIEPLADALRIQGPPPRDDNGNPIIPGTVLNSLRTVSVRIKDRIRDLILKDLASARDEAIPPAFRDQVDRYYEVLSRGVK